LYPVARYLIPPHIPEAKVSSIKLGKIDEFPSGTSKIVKFGTLPALIIRSDSGEFRAFSAICTHLNCTVQYREDWKLIWCACHNGKYDLNGKNTEGPPPRPLETFKIVIQENEVFLTKEV
jgi:Rieske Fe-S protein